MGNLFPDEGESSEALRDRLRSFGLTSKQIGDVLAANNETYIVENLAVVERNFETGKIEAQSLAKYT